MKEKYYELLTINEAVQVRSTVRRILEFIDSHAPDSRARDDLKLVFSELLYNALIHGNKEDVEKRVLVQVRAESERLYVCIEDEGQGFDYRRMIDYAKTDTALLSEHGRGMLLVCALTENLSFNETGNQVRFEKEL